MSECKPQLNVIFTDETVKKYELPTKESKDFPESAYDILNRLIGNILCRPDYKPSSHCGINAGTMNRIIEFAEVIEIGDKVIEIENPNNVSKGRMLTEVRVSPGNTRYASVDGVLFTKNMETLKFYPPNRPGDAYVVPDTVTEISNEAFAGAKNLRSVEIPEGVCNIGAGAFKQAAIESIRFPNSLKTIPINCAIGCYKLKTVIVGNSITKIGVNAMALCSKLEFIGYNGSIRIMRGFPDTLQVIDGSAFSGCKALKTVRYTGKSSLRYICEGAFANSGLTEFLAPPGLKFIGQHCFSASKLKIVDLPDTIERIGKYAFSHCTDLTEVEIAGNNRVVIEEGAFYSCSSLCALQTKAMLDMSLNAFRNCKSLDSFYCYCIPSKSILSIAPGLFCDCNKLRNVQMICDERAAGADARCELSEKAFGGCKSLTILYIGTDAERIIPFSRIDSDALNGCMPSEIYLAKDADLHRYSLRGCKTNVFAYSGHEGLTLNKEAEWNIIVSNAF